MIKDLLSAIQGAGESGKDTADAVQPTTEVAKKRIATNEMPVGIMAYMGDAVYEIIVRNFFIQHKLWDSHQIHRTVINFVNAGAQAAFVRTLEEHLTEEEKNILRRARNSNAGNVPRNAKVSDYRYSTGFEAVLGYLVLKGNLERLEEITNYIEMYLEEQISGKK